ncbi:MAG: glycosyltransferase [Clostridiales bacterium]|nr:glycosyltransferase [Clostridiales bacterium]
MSKEVLRPGVSIIVPVYNSGKLLEKCVDSLLAQTLTDIEIILVNDGSTDRSGELCDHYAVMDNRITVIRQQNQGPSAARNAGLAIAGGAYVGFVDSDDYVDTTMYENMYAIAKEHDVDIVNCDMYFIGESTQIIRTKIEKNRIIDLEKERRALFLTINSNGITVFAVRNIFRTEIVKGKVFFPPHTIGEEVPFVLETLLNARTYYSMDMPYYFYVGRPGSITHEKYNKQLLDLLCRQHECRENIYHSYGMDAFLFDLYQSTMDYTVPSLILNFINAPRRERTIKALKEIRNCEMIATAYKKATPSRSPSWKLGVLRFLLKYRVYPLVVLLTALSKH